MKNHTGTKMKSILNGPHLNYHTGFAMDHSMVLVFLNYCTSGVLVRQSRSDPGTTTWPPPWRPWQRPGWSSPTRSGTCSPSPSRMWSGLAEAPGGWSAPSSRRLRAQRRNRLWLVIPLPFLPYSLFQRDKITHAKRVNSRRTQIVR